MKKYLFLIVQILMISAYAQKSTAQTSEIAQSEKKSATKKMSLRVNPNTQNYDVTYQKLEFTVDPTKYFISGTVTSTITALANLSTITFDLSNKLIVNIVTQNGVAVPFVQNTNELVINL